jgi:invasion protein IalB
MIKGLLAAAAAALVVAGAANAHGQEAQSPSSSPAPRVLGTFQEWEAYLLVEGNRRTCYMASQPTKKEPANVRRGDVLVFVTHRPAEKERDVVNFHAGYPLRAGSEVQVAIGEAKFSLFVKGETAWARTTADDRALVAAMAKGATMTVVGTSERGTRTTDTYSLRGFTAAYREIAKACGLN